MKFVSISTVVNNIDVYLIITSSTSVQIHFRINDIISTNGIKQNKIKNYSNRYLNNKCFIS